MEAWIVATVGNVRLPVCGWALSLLSIPNDSPIVSTITHTQGFAWKKIFLHDHPKHPKEQWGKA